MGINLNLSTCSGCGACREICPTRAIEFAKNEQGFSYPKINADKCISCGKCKKICAKPAETNAIKRAVILRHSQDQVYNASQSGGAFTLFSDYVLANSGVVYGAHLNDTFTLSHFRATSREERNSMHGSVYIQSDAYLIFEELAGDLKRNRNVMFIGTPCQVSALKKYLEDKKVETHGLFLVDLLCHGVASVEVWRSLIAHYENKCMHPLSKIDWSGCDEQTRPYFTFQFGEISLTDSQFKKLYYSNLMMRPSCYQCSFTRFERTGDISIGDASGVRHNDSEFYNPKGTSLVLLNTPKGVEMWKSVMKKSFYKEVNIQDYLQQCLIEAAKTKRSPDEFWMDYKSNGMDYVLQKYAEHKIILNLRYIFRRILKGRG